MGAIPVPPKSTVDEHIRIQAAFLRDELEPELAEAAAGTRSVWFVDAAHIVQGTFLCCVWSAGRMFVRGSSGRRRSNVLGAWNAATGALVRVTNDTRVSADTMVALLGELSRVGTVPRTVVLDNARYQKCAAVTAEASRSGIASLYLPSYSPNPNLIERLWKFTKRTALRGKHAPDVAAFRAAIDDCLDRVGTDHRDALGTLMTAQFQVFDESSVLAA